MSPLRICVPARSVYEHHIYIEKSNSTFSWNFSTESNSISFGLFFKRSTDSATTSLSNQRRSIPRISRTNSATTSQTGSSKWTYSNGTSYTSESDMTTTTTNSCIPSMSQKYMNSSDKVKRKSSGNIFDTEGEELIPITRFKCSKEAVRGSFTVNSPGHYILLFDNSFSVQKKKELYLEVKSDDPNFEDREKEPELSGWLQRKNQQVFNSWSKQWFEYFPSGVLRVYSAPNGTIISSVQILFCAISTIASKKAIIVDSGTTRLCLRATSSDDFHCWTSCFRNRCTLSMEESGIQSAKSLFEETTNIRPDKVLKSLGELDIEVEILKGLIHQSLMKETNFTNANQSLESAYCFSTQTKRSLSFRKSSMTTESNRNTLPLSSMDLRQHLEKMLVSINRVDQCKANIYSDYTVLKSQWNNNIQSERTDIEVEMVFKNDTTMDLHRFSAQPDEFYDAEGVSLSSNEATPDSNNNNDTIKEQRQQNQQNPVTIRTTNKPVAPNHITRRTILPHPADEIKLSIIGLLRKNIHKDLMTVSLPVSINEPLGALQRQCEELEYSYLLDKASEQKSSMDRLLYVAAFAVSGYASSQYRIGRKPFNPLLAETFECIRPDRGFRFIAEKVSHHPNIMACFAESDNFHFRQTVTGRTKFWGKSLEWMPDGSNHVTLVKHNEHYTYTKPSSWVRNVAIGSRYLDHVGDMKVMNHLTGEYAVVTFMESTGGGFFGVAKDRNHIIAKFYNSSHNYVFKVTGKWSDILIHSKDQTVIWKVNPPALENYKDYFGFTQYCMELNEITELERGKLPKTDTRYRPDQRLFESGHLKDAEVEKDRIEEAQREHRKIYDTEQKNWTPLWFEKRVDGSDPTGESWFYKGGYWEAREKNQWPSPPFDLW